MPRTVSFETPVDTSQFTALQMQPRAVLSLAMTGWAHWLREHWVSFPVLVRDVGLGVVIAEFGLEYLKPFTFFDADTVHATVTLRARDDGALLRIDMQLASGQGVDVAKVTGMLRPVRVADVDSLSATAADLGNGLLSTFAADEHFSRDGRRRIAARVAELASGAAPVARHVKEFTVHRHLCEVADQWSAIAMPDLAAEVREELVGSARERDGALVGGLARPLRTLTFEFRRAAFFLDTVAVQTEAYVHGGDLTFVHRFHSGVGSAAIATLIESL
jgi:acyl-CoA thioesterase FadM